MQDYNPGQVRKYIRQLRQREQEYLYYLGQLAYQAGEQGRLEEGPMLDAYRTLKDIREQAARWEAYLEGLRVARQMPQVARCPRCGNFLAPGVPSCPYCGLSPITPYPVPGGVVVSTPVPGPVSMPPPAGPTVPPPGYAPAPPGQTGEASPPVVEVQSLEEEAQVPEGEGVLACRSCGKLVDDPEARFCPDCGTRLQE